MKIKRSKNYSWLVYESVSSVVGKVEMCHQRLNRTLKMLCQSLLLVLVLLCFSLSDGYNRPNNGGSRDFWSNLASVANNFLSGSSGGYYNRFGYRPNRYSYQNYRPNSWNRPQTSSNNQQSSSNYQQPSYEEKSQICDCRQEYRNKRQVINSTDLEEYDEDGLNTRIVGGHNTRRSAYPEMVLIQLNSRQHCGGTILNKYYIMTAAHCIAKQSDASKFSVTVGAYDLNDLSGTRTIKVSRGIYHPDYNSVTYDNDIALLELEEPIDFSSKAQPACIPVKQRNHDGDMATAVGWGKISESGPAAKIQQEVKVPILSNSACSRKFSNRYAVTKNMICAGYDEGGKDACGGDSGGPLFVSGNDGNRLQVGVTSFGEGCARANRPGVYTRVDQESDFLLQNMPNAGSCAILSPDGQN